MKLLIMNYRKITHLSSSSVFISSQKKECEKGLQKKEKQRFMYTGKLFAHTHHNHLLTIYLLCVVYNFYLCVKMTVYSPSVHFVPSKQWKSPWFVWGKRNFILPWQFEISAFLFPSSSGVIWALVIANLYLYGGSGHLWQYFLWSWLQTWCLLRL